MSTFSPKMFWQLPENLHDWKDGRVETTWFILLFAQSSFRHEVLDFVEDPLVCAMDEDDVGDPTFDADVAVAEHYNHLECIARGFPGCDLDALMRELDEDGNYDGLMEAIARGQVKIDESWKKK